MKSMGSRSSNEDGCTSHQVESESEGKHMRHDLCLRTGIAAKAACYGSALALTLVSAAGLLYLG